MNMETVIHRPVFRPEISFKVELLPKAEQATIVHCKMLEETGIRIWKSTYLIQQDGKRKQLLYAFNIPEYPSMYKWVREGYFFTLVFEGLDKACTIFDLLEEIPEPGGFHVSNIKRNTTDVYCINIGY